MTEDIKRAEERFCQFLSSSATVHKFGERGKCLS